MVVGLVIVAFAFATSASGQIPKGPGGLPAFRCYEGTAAGRAGNDSGVYSARLELYGALDSRTRGSHPMKGVGILSSRSDDNVEYDWQMRGDTLAVLRRDGIDSYEWLELRLIAEIAIGKGHLRGTVTSDRSFYLHSVRCDASHSPSER